MTSDNWPGREREIKRAMRTLSLIDDYCGPGATGRLGPTGATGVIGATGAMRPYYNYPGLNGPTGPYDVGGGVGGGSAFYDYSGGPPVIRGVTYSGSSGGDGAFVMLVEDKPSDTRTDVQKRFDAIAEELAES